MDLLVKLSETKPYTEQASSIKGTTVKTSLKEDNILQRGKDKMHNQDCPCCTKFYEAIKYNGQDILLRQGLVSRHRYRDDMPGTPPGFWSVGFTQDSAQ
jgi:hypothetical protein